MNAEREFPKRLLSGDDASALLIRRALAEAPIGSREEQSFARLEARLGARPVRWLLPALACSGLAAAATWLFLARPSAEPISVAPDKWAPSATESPREAARLEAASAAPSALPLPVSNRVAPRTEARAGVEADPAACGALARAADYEGAAACYARIARGSSMSAELSLYEKARIEAKALGQRERALATLNEHARRFPAGSLHSEVGLTRIELLSQLGRRAEALAAIEQALGGALGRERAADLQVLRAELLSAQGDCAPALEAVKAARAAGAHPARLESIDRRCAVEDGAP